VLPQGAQPTVYRRTTHGCRSGRHGHARQSGTAFHSQRGQALVELALVAPVLLLLVLGAVELGAAFQAKITITNAAREGARLAGRGNIFTPSQVLQVVQGQSRSVDIAGSGTAILTTVDTSDGGFDYRVNTLCGGETSRLDYGELQALHQELIVVDPAYLQQDQFVVLEIIYDHTALTGLFGDSLTMYAYAVMPVSAPS